MVKGVLEGLKEVMIKNIYSPRKSASADKYQTKGKMKKGQERRLMENNL